MSVVGSSHKLLSALRRQLTAIQVMAAFLVISLAAAAAGGMSLAFSSPATAAPRELSAPPAQRESALAAQWRHASRAAHSHAHVTAASVRQYIIVSGDTLSGVSERFYGTYACWPGIFAASAAAIGGDPDLVYPGQRVSVPWHCSLATSSSGAAAGRQPHVAAADAIQHVSHVSHSGHHTSAKRFPHASPVAHSTAASYTASGSPQRIAEGMLSSYGWSASGQMSCLSSLWTRESGWRYDAENPGSGAYGIPQSLPASKMASAGSDYMSNPATQIKWGEGYIKDVYGSPCGAWDHELAKGWY